MEHWITIESFGDTVPANWEEIASFLNEIIRDRNIQESISDVNDLWEQYCNGDIDGAPEPEDPKPELWYAIMMDEDDTDWGTGTFDRDEAIARVKELRDDYPEAYIAVIENGPDPICVDTIKEF